MTNTRIGTKKSSFSAVTTVDGNSYLDFVYNGQNYRIKYSDFINQLGVSGSIEQDGDPLGVPVLDFQGSVNAIRNLVGGQGIDVAIDGQNSITIDTDFSFDDTGAAIVDDVLASAPAFRSLTAGTDINIAESAGKITINANTDGLKPANQVIINQASDFPAAVGGRIPLAPNTEYYIGSQVVITNPFSLSGNTAIRGAIAASVLVYTGTESLFQGTDIGGLSGSNLFISAPAASFLELADTVPATLVSIFNVVAVFDSVGSCDGIFGITFDLGAFTGLSNGYKVEGTGSSIISVSKMRFTANAGATSFRGIDLNLNEFTSVEIENVVFSGPAGGYGISGVANNFNMAPGSIAKINSCEFTGGLTPLEKITEDDIRFNFSLNSDIADTAPDALISLTANTVHTVSPSSPTLVAGLWATQGVSHFSATSSGRITYLGEREILGPITVTLAVAPAAGTNKSITAFIYVDGVQIPETQITVTADSGDPIPITLIWQEPMVQNKYVEVYVQNNSDSTDLIVSNAVSRIR